MSFPPYEVVDSAVVQRIKFPNDQFSWSTFFGRLVQLCTQDQKESDCVQFLSLRPGVAPWVKEIRRSGISTVFTATMMGEFSNNPIKRAWQRLDRKRRFNMVDQVVVSSGVMLKQLRYLGVSVPIKVIPNGVDLTKFKPPENGLARSRLKEALGLDSNWEVVTAVGPITPRKGIDQLVEAFVRLIGSRPNIHLVLVGPRHDRETVSLQHFSRNLDRTIVEWNAKDRVHFTGGVDNVADYLRASDILVFSSKREGMPNVIPEAMACGVPVIMTPFIGLPEEFGVAGTHYVLSDRNVETLAANIEKLLDDPGLREHISRRARIWVEDNLTVRHSLDQYASLYHDLCEGRRRQVKEGS